jgi:hypothetical protein
MMTRSSPPSSAASTRLFATSTRRGSSTTPPSGAKIDHRNALGSYAQLDALLTRTGFEMEKIRYYNVLFKSILGDLMLPLVGTTSIRRETKRNKPRVTVTRTGR